MKQHPVPTDPSVSLPLRAALAARYSRLSPARVPFARCLLIRSLNAANKNNTAAATRESHGRKDRGYGEL